jgi:hypothetical protein
MKVQSRNQQIVCAYALLFTVAAGLMAADPVERHADSLLADVAIPTPKTFKATAASRLQPATPGAGRLARR